MRLYSALFIILFTPGFVLTQQRPFTIEEAVKIGIEKSKSLRISHSGVQLAEARSSESAASLLPTLRLSAGYMRLSEVDPFRVVVPFSPNPITLSPTVLNNYTIKASLHQPLFTGFRLHSLSQSAQYAAEASHRDYEMERVQFIFHLKTVYWNLYKTMELSKVVNENVEQMRAHLKDIENLYAQGLATANDVLKVQVQLSSTELLQIEAKNAVKTAMISLNTLLGLPLETEISISSRVAPIAPPSESLQEVISEALSRRPDLRALDLKVKASEARVTAAQGSWFPQVYLVGNYYYARPNVRILPTLDKFRDTWDVGVTLEWNLWNWGATGAQVNQTDAQFSQISAAYEQMKDGIILEVTESYLHVLRTGEKIYVAERGKEQAEENYRVTRERFMWGMATNSDLLDAEVALLQAKMDYTLATVDLELAQAKLLESRGREN